MFGLFFFFKQKTAYEMRISDWSSDVCSSDLADGEDMAGDDRGRIVQEGGIDPALEAAACIARQAERLAGERDAFGGEVCDLDQDVGRRLAAPTMLAAHDARDVVDARVVGGHRHPVAEPLIDRKNVVEGKRLIHRESLGGRRIIKKKKKHKKP